MPTSYERYRAARMKKPMFAKAYAKARAEIDSVDQMIRALDEARAAANISKAELARRIRSSPVVVRKLLTQKSPNPSFKVVSKLAQAVGMRIVLEVDRPHPSKPRSTTART